MFSAKAHNSIILVTSHLVIRQDFARDRPIYRLQANVDPESGLKQAVEQVVRGHRKLSANTLVLSSEIWSQLILLPSRSVLGISQLELTEALKFETETLSGFDVDNLSLACLPLRTVGEHQEFWVSALQTSELNEVHRMIEHAGGRTISFAHPAGLAGKNASSHTHRVEAWSRLSFLFEANQKGPAKIVQSGATVQFDIQKHWPETSSSEILVLAGPGEPTGRLEHVDQKIDLSEEADFQSWLTAIAADQVQAIDSLVPTLHIGKKNHPEAPRRLVAALLAMAVAGFCCWHHQYLDSRNAELKTQVELVQEPGRQKKDHDSRLTAIREARKKLESEAAETRNNLKRVHFFVDQQRVRLAKMLNLLVELRKDEMVIEKIGGSPDGVVISGTSLNGESAQAFAKRLREIAFEVGWIVNPAKQEGQQKLTSGGPWKFDILLSDAGPIEVNRTADRNSETNKN